MSNACNYDFKITCYSFCIFVNLDKNYYNVE